MSTQSRIGLFNGFTLDLERGCVTRSGEQLHLRPQTYEVLKYLSENRGILISKDKLIEEVWRGRAVTDGSLGKCIEEIREAFGAEARQFIRNVRGRGYIFERETSEHPSQTLHSQQLEVVSVLVQDETHSRLTSSHKLMDRTRSAVWIVLTIVVATAACALIYVNYYSRRSAQINSIAVLPFVNVTAGQNAAYLSDGLTESLIDELAKIPGLKVIARSSSFTYKGRDIDVHEVGRALGVHAVVTGRFEQRGDNLIVSVEFVDARDRSRLWGDQYTRRIIDLQELQGEIARGIAEKLQLQLRVAQERSKQVTVNPQAYEFYLNGLFHFNEGSSNGMRKALEYFNQAVLLDPNFALAWAWVSRANNLLGGNSLLNPKDTQVKARAAAERALELDQTLADAHFALGRIRQDEWDWAGADKEYRRAIELSPSLAYARAEYAQFLAIMTRHAEALNEIRRAQELDPMSVRLKRREAWVLHLSKRSNEGLALLRDTLKNSPPTAGSHRALGFMYEAGGLAELAIQEFRAAIALDGEGTGNLCYLAGALAVAGRKKEASQIIGRLNRSKEYVSPTELAAVYARLKDIETTISLLEKAYADRDPQLQTLSIDPFFDNVSSDTRFQNLLTRVGLPLLQ